MSSLSSLHTITKDNNEEVTEITLTTALDEHRPTYKKVCSSHHNIDELHARNDNNKKRLQTFMVIIYNNLGFRSNLIFLG